MPKTAALRVAVGQTAVAGETVLAEFGGVPGTPLVGSLAVFMPLPAP